MAHLAHAEGAAPGLEADEEIDDAGHQHHQPPGEGEKSAHDALGHVGQGGAGAEDILHGEVDRQHIFLLVVNPDIRRAAAVVGHAAEKVEDPVSKGAVGGVLCPVGRGLGAGEGGEHGEGEEQCQHRRHSQGMVEEGQGIARWYRLQK